jgi:LysR substrate binding domain
LFPDHQKGSELHLQELNLLGHCGGGHIELRGRLRDAARLSSCVKDAIRAHGNLHRRCLGPALSLADHGSDGTDTRVPFADDAERARNPTRSNKWLLPRLGSLIDLHPDLEVRLDGTNEPTDFDRESVDVEIRHGDGRWPGLFVEGLAEEEFWPVCAPTYASAGSLAPAELPSRRLIHSVKSQAQWPPWFALAGVEPSTRWRKVLFDRSHMAIDAAAGGLGIALESTLMTERELAQGVLVRPVQDAPEIRIVTQWIVCPRDHLRRRKVQLFLDWLRQERDVWQAAQRK